MVTEWIAERWARAAAIGVLGLWVGGLGGCAAALPIVGDQAATALSATVALFEAGKEVTYEPVGIEEVAAAVRRAQRELDLVPMGEETSTGGLELRYADLKGQEIVVTLAVRTRRMTRICVDIGWFGRMGIATWCCIRFNEICRRRRRSRVFREGGGGGLDGGDAKRGQRRMLGSFS